MFADDVKINLIIINDVDIVQLQLALTSLVEWGNEWQLAISIEKCCVLNIGKQVPTPCLHLDYCTLPVVPRTKLGYTCQQQFMSECTHKLYCCKST